MVYDSDNQSICNKIHSIIILKMQSESRTTFHFDCGTFWLVDQILDSDLKWQSKRSQC